MGVQIAFDFFEESAEPTSVGGGGPCVPPGPSGSSHAWETSRISGSVQGPGCTPPESFRARGKGGAGGAGGSPVRTRSQLEAELAALTGLPLSLLVSDNERTMISTRRGPTGVIVRLHHMFLSADPATLRHLAGYLDRSDSGAGEYLGCFIARHRDRIRRPGPRRVRLQPAGEHHDLREIFERLNRAYFDAAVDARVTWGRRTTARDRGDQAGSASRRSIKLGSYSAKDRLIRVHPALDADWVPDFFVTYIVYHEMLHQIVPPRATGGRRAFHSREFRERELRFSAYDEAIAWERANLRRLLRA